MKEAQRDLLHEKYSKKEMIVIDSKDDDENDQMLAGFLPSHLDIDGLIRRESLLFNVECSRVNTSHVTNLRLAEQSNDLISNFLMSWSSMYFCLFSI